MIAADKNTHPDFLKGVFGGVAVAGEEKQITHETVLIPDDELLEQARFLEFEASGDGKAFLPRLIVGYQGRCSGEKRANGSKCHLSQLDDKTVGEDQWNLGPRLTVLPPVRNANT